jgi:cytochrome oxidase Cu insertion factor (SCO1/SenC/PrrC family)
MRKIQRRLQGTLLAVLLMGSSVQAKAERDFLEPPMESRVVGKRIPGDAVFRDESGAPFSLVQLKTQGKRFLLAPLFTSCKHTCAAIAEGVKSALKGVPDAERPQVVLLSFDPDDTAEGAAEFRKSQELPKDWRILIGNSQNIARVLEVLDFRPMRSSEAGFLHPNAVFALDSTLQVRGIWSGTKPTSDWLKTVWEQSSLWGLMDWPVMDALLLVAGVIGLVGGALILGHGWSLSRERKLNSHSESGTSGFRVQR